MAESQKKGARLSDAERERNAARTRAKSAKRAEKYEARHQDNLSELASRGGERILIQRFKSGVPMTDPKSKKPILRMESPSEALARLNRSK